MPRPIGLSKLKVRTPSHQYRDVSSRPYIGSNSMLTAEEYKKSVRRVCVARYGTFDTAKPDKEADGRTLHEVLTRIAAGEYRLFCPMQRKWVKDTKHGLRELVSVFWIEDYDVDGQDYQKMARSKR